MIRPVHRRVVQHDFYDTAEQVAGVVLLNSPSCSPWEFEEYLQLLKLKRFSPPQQGTSSPAHCYFLCSDGAYPMLRQYVSEEMRRRPVLRPFILFQLCDAVIGDMDSYDSVCGMIDVELPPSAPCDGYATVNDIPPIVLSTIRDRSISAAALFATQNEALSNIPVSQWDEVLEQRMSELFFAPLWLHVRCQMTTDFMKALVLLQRLRKQHTDNILSLLPPVLRSPDGLQFLQTGGNILPGASSAGCNIDPDRERNMCAEAAVSKTVNLPTYVTFGALGGRFDHSMGAISVILSMSKEAHVVLTDSFNTIFACQPNGWTQIVRHPDYEGVMCGLINFGPLNECETSGLLWNIVCGRGKPNDLQHEVFGFGNLLSVCNTIRHEVVTIDLRRVGQTDKDRKPATTQQTNATHADAQEVHENCNPPTIFSIQRRVKRLSSETTQSNIQTI